MNAVAGQRRASHAHRVSRAGWLPLPHGAGPLEKLLPPSSADDREGKPSGQPMATWESPPLSRLLLQPQDWQ